MDGNFIFAGLKYKLDIRERIQKLLQNEETKLYILKSSMAELQSMGEKASDCMEFAKSYCEVLNDEGTFGETIVDKICSFLSITV